MKNYFSFVILSAIVFFSPTISKARYYDPSTGIFLQEDPQWNVNFYNYADNNPLTYIDPSGTYIEYRIPDGYDRNIMNKAVGIIASTDVGRNILLDVTRTKRIVYVSMVKDLKNPKTGEQIHGVAYPAPAITNLFYMCMEGPPKHVIVKINMSLSDRDDLLAYKDSPTTIGELTEVEYTALILLHELFHFLGAPGLFDEKGQMSILEKVFLQEAGIE